MEKAEGKNKVSLSLDIKDTAGWKLMQHEENLRRFLNRERGNGNGRKTDTDRDNKCKG